MGGDQTEAGFRHSVSDGFAILSRTALPSSDGFAILSRTALPSSDGFAILSRTALPSSDGFAGLEPTCVRKLALHWLDHEALANRASACLHTNRSAVHHGGDILQVGHEGALFARGRLDTDSAQVLRFTAVLADES
jgi:hypothetical protein